MRELAARAYRSGGRRVNWTAALGLALVVVQFDELRQLLRAGEP